ncbi:RidA family protein [Pontibaca salina]|uniref:RidA family protein n=1 Tax=Pontibaca salina TaxID=2795731 RepID=A0A934LXI0_9RHOB|nr:RidA family protein [Pontibaca salina]MBI6628647.1 RidA family protein [Pontibaca salina]
MTIERISSGGEFEAKIGYCRAVVAGGWVHVSGTVGQGETATEQCRSALSVIGTALEKAGAGFADVVRVSYILPDSADFEACWPILVETFGANPPAMTMFESKLIDPKYLIEIEVTALLPQNSAS